MSSPDNYIDNDDYSLDSSVIINNPTLHWWVLLSSIIIFSSITIRFAYIAYNWNRDSLNLEPMPKIFYILYAFFAYMCYLWYFTFSIYVTRFINNYYYELFDISSFVKLIKYKISF